MREFTIDGEPYSAVAGMSYPASELLLMAGVSPRTHELYMDLTETHKPTVVEAQIANGQKYFTRPIRADYA